MASIVETATPPRQEIETRAANFLAAYGGPQSPRPANTSKHGQHHAERSKGIVGGALVGMHLSLRFARAREALREYPGWPSKITASEETASV
jgi:hypothetical protein